MQRAFVRFLGAACLIITLVIPGPVFADTSSAQRRITLAARTIVSGRTSGYVSVRLQEEATISGVNHYSRSSGPNSAIDFHGAGRHIGVAIVEDPYLTCLRMGSS